MGERLPAEVSFCGFWRCLREVWPLSMMGGVVLELPSMFFAAGPWSMVERAAEFWLLQAHVRGVGGCSPGEFVMRR